MPVVRAPDGTGLPFDAYAMAAPQPFVDMLRPRGVWACGPLRGALIVAGRDSRIDLHVADAAATPTLDDRARMLFTYIQLRWGGHAEYFRAQLLDATQSSGETLPLSFNDGPPLSVRDQFVQFWKASVGASSVTEANAVITLRDCMVHYRSACYPEILERLRSAGVTACAEDLSATDTKVLPFYLEQQHRAILYYLAASCDDAPEDSVRAVRERCVREALLREAMKPGKVMDALVTYIVDTAPVGNPLMRWDLERMETWARMIATEHRHVLATMVKDGVRRADPSALIDRMRSIFPWPSAIFRMRKHVPRSASAPVPPIKIELLSEAYRALIRREVARAKVPPERRTRVEAEVQRRVRKMIEQRQLPREPEHHVRNTIGAIIVVIMRY